MLQVIILLLYISYKCPENFDFDYKLNNINTNWLINLNIINISENAKFIL